jgi:CHAT domain-containing protein
VVELLHYQPYDPRIPGPDKWGDWRYVAYVLPAGGKPAWADLGPADPIDELVVEARRELARADPRYAEVARALDAQVMQPIRRLLGDARDVYLSPDGALNLVPFAALVDEDGRFLVSRYRFTWLTSGRDLLRLDAPDAPRSGPVILAGPDYGRGGRAGAGGRGAAARGAHSLDLRGVRFAPLPGAAREGRELTALVPGARLLTAGAATEASVKALRGPRILHVATHGFFLDELPRGPGRTRGRGRGAEPIAGDADDDAHDGGGGDGDQDEDPLLRSGLALAGANARRSGGEDGILTALEVTGLDLRGTKLVALSACETAVGEATSGSGVYGLRSALMLAGAESQVMSLWKVDDEATRLLMDDYYRRLGAGGGRSDALREAQLALLARARTAHPFYWAAWIASGDQRSLDGKAAPSVHVAGPPTSPGGASR